MSARLRTCASTTVLALAAAMGPLAAPAQANPANYRVVDRAETDGVTADALPTTQIDGVAYTQAIAGKTVFVGGDFANARPAGAAPGTQLTPRANLLAYDLVTGELRSELRFDTNDTVKVLALSPGGSRLYVGGSFTSIAGQTRYRLAAIDIATGYSYLPGQFEGAALIEPGTGALTWMADCRGDSYSAAAGHGLAYVARHHHHCDNINSFPQVNSTMFKYAQAFTYQATGTVKTNSQAFYTNYAGNPAPSQVNWFPEFSMGTTIGLNQSAWSVATHGDHVVHGGEFPRVNGTAQQGWRASPVPASPLASRARSRAVPN